MKLGEALLETGAITKTQLDSALKDQQSGRKKPLGELLIDAGVVTEEQLQIALAKKLGFPLIKLDVFPVEDEALLKVPATTATRLKILPILKRQQMLVVAMEDPWRYSALDELKFATQLKIVPVMAPPRSVEAAIYRQYVERSGPWQVPPETISAGNLLPDMEFGGNIKDLAKELDGDEEGDNTGNRQVQESDNALVRLVNSMILDAYQRGASDIHVECYPGKEKVRIRFRQDGSLVSYLELPASHRAALIARLKIMADLDISEKRKPQDGKINFAKFGPARIELRLASIPTANGLEDMVLRILASAKPVPLDHLGLAKHNVTGMHAIMERPYGLFLICGPTGSGKTTTLHSAISYINVPERKIWTAEDPVEITQPGLRQVQVQPKIGWTFATALRAFLRADPDVIMVGEMRDEETAHIGVEASLTGHLVLSTLHTNSAPESVTRLLDMGLDPFNFGDSLLGILAQRLVKKMCKECKVAEPASQEWIEQLLDDYCHQFAEDSPITRADIHQRWVDEYAEKGQFMRYTCKGCEECNHTGLKGRLGIHELLQNSRAVKRLIQKGARAEEIQAQALLDGMRTLKQDGIEKVLQGLTTLEEVRAATAG
ncbi:pilus assembly protein PilB [Parvibium lacunae]|uniref:Pilus assembly protein PilB n=2 Tax=Parvibium lacunae TaxID=1888893 RepID=A0A368L5B9_9BURK|nr:pilus assembly protein PilB [Parvibium lacunae]